MNDQLWAAFEDRIAEIARRIVREEIERKQSVSLAPTDWMTEAQLAEYWQLMADGKPTVHSIRKWTARSPDQHPLPCGHMGTLRRYHRKVVDQWAIEEDERERLKRVQTSRRAME